jgi:hypothetical protein
MVSGGNGDADEAAGVEGDGGAFDATVLEEGAEMGVGIAGDVKGCCCDEVVPRCVLGLCGVGVEGRGGVPGC